MVCAKCQRLSKSTTKLATPDVKKKSELYHGSSSAAGSSKTGPTLGATGVSKSKLLSKSAKNPYASYSSNCASCTKQVESGRKYCQRCAYTKQLCAICGKTLAAGEGSTSKAPVVSGQKYTQK
ncbi:hypothetical protein C1H76_8456 [Elsinoe australis]|uniref:Cysteine-rich PDZ-binding protein n=1 Tax=Elsinoe australis TaxID=40998 RepID=A0A4U7AS24_9PEZI|nr:hypothetical protein C1H76_8456 [Elsinoe australis]